MPLDGIHVDEKYIYQLISQSDRFIYSDKLWNLLELYVIEKRKKWVVQMKVLEDSDATP